MSTWWKRSTWIAAGLALAVLLVLAFRPSPIPVDAAAVERTHLSVSVDDDGMTRVRERHVISAPIQGRLLRTPLDAGDAVTAGATVVAEFVPVAPDLLDARALEEARARLAASETAVREAEARRLEAEAEARFAAQALERQRALHRESVVSQGDLDAAERLASVTEESLGAARVAVDVARFERDVARASLREPKPEDLTESLPAEEAVSGPEAGAAGGGRIELDPQPGHESGEDRRLALRSPVTGRVLRVFEESARTLPAGTPILEVGSTASLEVVADYLTQDAVKVRPGMRVRLHGWGGEDGEGSERVLAGRVRVVEPGGFTKVSALGVEEQRTNVVVDPAGEAEDWAALGDGYRVELSIVLWEQDGVLVVPTGALFRVGADWCVFAIEDGRASRRAVRLGRRGGLEAQVLEGLVEDDLVVLYPSELLEDGARVRSRMD